MKAVIVANQDGRQLMPLTAKRPVCLLEFGGQTLLERAIEGAASAGVSEVLILTSPRDNAAISGAVADTPGGLPVHKAVCKSTGQGNVSDALWELFIKDDVLLVHADLLCAAGLFNTVSRSGPGILLVTGKEEAGKTPPCLLRATAGTLNGILKRDDFTSRIMDPVSLKTALHDSTVKEELCDDGPWITIRTLDDLREAEERVYPRIEDLEKRQALPAESGKKRSPISRIAGYIVTGSILLRLEPKYLEIAAALSAIVSAVLFLWGYLSAAIAGSLFLAGFFVLARAGNLIRTVKHAGGTRFGLSGAEITAGLINFAAMAFCLYRDINTVSVLWAACWILMLLIR